MHAIGIADPRRVVTCRIHVDIDDAGGIGFVQGEFWIGGELRTIHARNALDHIDVA